MLIKNMRREGTKNYYYMDANKSQWEKISSLVNHINEVIEDIGLNDSRKGDI